MARVPCQVKCECYLTCSGKRCIMRLQWVLPGSREEGKMHRWARGIRWGLLVLLALLLVACEGYTESMARTSSSQTMSGGRFSAHIG